MPARRAALVGAVLLAFSPIALNQGQESRGYPIVVLVDAIALLAVALQWRRGQQAHGAWRWAWPAITAAAVIFGAQLPFTAILFAAALFGAVAIVLLAPRPFPVMEFAIWAVAGSVAGLVSLLQVMDALSLAGAPGTNWIWPLGPWTLGVFLADFVAGPRAPLRCVGVVAAAPVYALLALGLVRWSPARRAAWLILLIAPALFLVLLLGVSLVRPLLISRYALWLVLPLCLLLGHVAVASRGAPRVAAVAAILFGWGLGVVYHGSVAPRDDWPRLAAALQSERACAGPVVFGPYSSPLGLVHYAPDLRGREMRMIAMPEARSAASETLLGIWELYARPIGVQEVAAPSQAGAHPVLVLRTFDLPVRDNGIRAMVTHAHPLMRADSWASAWCL